MDWKCIAVGKNFVAQFQTPFGHDIVLPVHPGFGCRGTRCSAFSGAMMSGQILHVGSIGCALGCCACAVACEHVENYIEKVV